MMSKKITIQISPKGKATLSGSGFSGTTCDDAMRPFEDALGNGDTFREDSPEYYEDMETERDAQSW